jgi:signal transduction histidine kinase
MDSWKGSCSARPGVIARASDGRAALSNELASALERVRGAAQGAVHAESHEQCALELKEIIAEARLALALNASLEASADTERGSQRKPVTAASQPPVSGVMGPGWLVRSVVHDLNNMLLVIQNCAEAMKQQPSLVAREAGVVEDAVTQATRLIAKLLPPDSSVGRLPGTDLSQTVLQFSGVLRSLVGQRVSIVTRLASGLPHARCDEMAVGRILSNLATNARDAMPDGGTLTLETRLETRKAPDGLDVEAVPYVVLGVSDTGQGMDSTTQGRAFDPFFTTKEAGKGSGVGLATVRELVHGAGGFLELDTSVGQGTTLRVFLRALGHWR